MDSKPNGEAEVAKDSDAQPAGRIVHDSRGNAVWSRASADSTSTMLKRLDIPDLKVEGQEEAPPPLRPAAAAPAKHAPTQNASAPTTDVKQGYNPYDQHVAIRKPTTPKGPVGRRKAC
jgi:hypothetical protein